MVPMFAMNGNVRYKRGCQKEWLVKNVLVSLVALALAAGVAMSGCGQKDTGEGAGKTPPAVKEAERMDSTRMDSATVDSVPPENLTEPHDSM